jgi:hypothetical protein
MFKYVIYIQIRQKSKIYITFYKLFSQINKNIIINKIIKY